MKILDRLGRLYNRSQVEYVDCRICRSQTDQVDCRIDPRQVRQTRSQIDYVDCRICRSQIDQVDLYNRSQTGRICRMQNRSQVNCRIDLGQFMQTVDQIFGRQTFLQLKRMFQFPTHIRSTKILMHISQVFFSIKIKLFCQFLIFVG